MRQRRLPTHTGTKAAHPNSSNAAELNTMMAVVPPAGGWTERVAIMATREKETARGRASALVPMGAATYSLQRMPMTAERICPKKTLRGCEKGLSGAAKRMTAEAPKLPRMAV